MNRRETLEKDAALGSFLATHIGSNAVTKALIGTKAGGKHFGKLIGNYATGDTTKAGRGLGVLASSISGALPEVEGFLTTATNKSANHKDTIKSAINVGKARAMADPNKDMASKLKAYRRLFKNKTDKDFIEMAEHPDFQGNAKKIIGTLKGNPIGAAVIKRMPNMEASLIHDDPTVRKKAMEEVVKIKNGSNLIKNVIPSALDNFHRKADSLKPKKNILERTVAGASLIGTTAVDPASGLFSSMKRGLMSDHLPNAPIIGKPIGKVQKKLQKVFIKNRSEVMFNEGLGVNNPAAVPKKGIGEKISGALTGSAKITTNKKVRPVAKFIDTFGVNPITSDIKNTAFDAGNAERRAGEYLKDFNHPPRYTDERLARLK